MFLKRDKRMYLSGGRRNIYNRKKRISPMVVCIVLAVVLLIAAILYSAIDSYKKKNLVTEYINNALSYTESQDYTSALKEYNKALKAGGGKAKFEIQKGMVDCYIKNGQSDEAVDYVKLLLARNEVKNEQFSEIALMVNAVDPASAYRLLETYAENNKTDNESIQKLITSSENEPVTPQLDMLQGTYVKISNVKFKVNNENFGHSIYYTTNNEKPDEFSKIYRGGFPMDATTDLRVVSYNSKGVASEVGLYSFTVDKDMYNTLEDLITQAEKLLKNTRVGVDEGQTNQDNIDRLNDTVNAAKQLLERDNVLFMDAENHVEYLKAAIDEFNSRINKNVGKEELETLTVFAEEIYSAVSKASIANNVNEYLDSLNTAISAAKNTYVGQASLNTAYHTLYQCLLALNKAGYKAAYKALLISNNCNNYIIYDVNDDMIPELILNQGTNNENYFYTYSVSQGEAVRVKDESGFATFRRFYNHNDGILACTTDDDNGDFYLIDFVANEIVISEKKAEYNTNETLRTSLSPIMPTQPADTSVIDNF